MADIRRIPFTEMVERTRVDFARDQSTAESKFKGRINDVYMYDLPSQIDYRHIAKTGELTTTAGYSTGYITDVSATTATGDSDCLWTSAISNTMLLKVSGYDEPYRVTYVSGTSLTLDRTWIGDAIASTDTSYNLYQDRYALGTDYDRMIQDPDECVWYMSSGVKTYLKYKDPGEFRRLQTYVIGEPNTYTVEWVNDDPYLYINSPATSAMTIYYKYIPTLARMTEYIGSTIKELANAGTAVELNAGDADGYLSDFDTYSYYFRVDSDGTGSASVWYKVASATDDTNFTLSDAYGGTTITSGTSAYTLSRVSLLPAGLDLAMIYGAALASVIDQDNKTQIASWGAEYARIVNQYKSVESRKGYGKQRLKTVYERPGARR